MMYRVTTTIRPHPSCIHTLSTLLTLTTPTHTNNPTSNKTPNTKTQIWAQTRGRVDAFVSGAGTGGTIAGVSAALKARDPTVKVLLIDPPGSSLYNRITRGVLYAREEAEGARLRHPFDTVTEGIGLNRLTANFAAAAVDGAFRGTDREAVEMAAHLLR